MRIDMAIENEGTVVQTRLDKTEYERLRRVADQEDISLKEALRRATVEFVRRTERLDPNDPFFSAEEPDVPSDGDCLTARKTEEYLYEE